ncbi:MAG: thiamine phosphate synthase [Phenylobacterium sp.]
MAGAAAIGAFWTLERTAALLSRRNRGRKTLPPLLAFTDPERTPDPEAVAERLPRSAALVYRAFGAGDAEAQGARLMAVAGRRSLVLLIGADAVLAARLGADGVHLPERLAHRARRLKSAHPRWLVTGAAHSLTAARRALAAGCDAAVVSTVFASRSASAGAPLGSVRTALLVRAIGGPVYALGGIGEENARRLLDAGLIGLAAVGAFGA